LAGLSKSYPDGTRAVSTLDLEIADGEFVVLVGPSGCGKTTVLRMIAGLEAATEGEIRIGESVVNRLEAYRRDIAMVFQNYALYPHMSVFDNMAFPLRAQRLPRKEIQERVRQTAALLGLEEQLRRRPRNLSGGQRQRVAMGRAIVRQPKVFLMDEPLSNLDAKLRVKMRAEISRLQGELGITTIYVTHDQVEAMTMGDRIAVMRKGVLQQVGSPQTLYDSPANLFVAGFIGSPAMNLFQGAIEANGSGVACRIGEHLLPLPAGVSTRTRLADYLGRAIAVGIRPEDLGEPGTRSPDHPHMRGRVTLVETLGRESLVHLEIDAEPVRTEDVLEVLQDVDAAEAASVAKQPSGGALVEALALFSTSSTASAGASQDVTVDTSKLHFFDLASGAALA
jgi:multiple sugar transport system ATP-binding protein